MTSQVELSHDVLADPWRNRHVPLIRASLDFALHAMVSVPSRILDVGGGDGLVIAELLLRLPAARAWILDKDEVPARELILHAYGVCERVTSVTASVASISDVFAGQSFDLIICRSALHHFRDPQSVLADIGQMLSPGGYLLLCDAFFPAHSSDVWSALNQIRESDFGHYFTYHDILDLVALAGLEIRLIRPYKFIHSDLDAYVFPAEAAVHGAIKRAIWALDSQTKREMRIVTSGNQLQFEYNCFDLLACYPTVEESRSEELKS